MYNFVSMFLRYLSALLTLEVKQKQISAMRRQVLLKFVAILYTAVQFT